MKEKLNQFLFGHFSSIYLLCLFYILTSLNDELWLANWKDVALVIAFFIGAIFLLQTISYKVKKNLAGQEVLIFFCLFSVLLLPKLQSNLIAITNAKIKLTYLLVLMGAIIIFVGFKIFFGSNTNFKNIKKYFSVLLVMFFIIEICIIPGILKQKQILDLSISDYTKATQKNTIQLNAKPNIYHIIFDAYTSLEGLEEYWQFKDTLFLSSLKKDTFDIAYDAHTCKDNTLECITAIFNMKNLKIPIKFRSIATKSEVYRKLIQNGEVVNQLTSNGYQINNLSLFDMSDKTRYWNFPWLEPNITFQQFCFYQSLLGNFYKNYLDRSKGYTNLQVISEMKEVIKSTKKQPSFSYIHLMMPHPPNNFDKNGRIVGRKTYSNTAYLDELGYCNKVMIETIDLIKEHDPSAILILQSDHGSGMLPEVYEEEVKSVLSILVAPKLYHIEWPNDMLNHNTYKYIFNALSNDTIPITPCQD